MALTDIEVKRAEAKERPTGSATAVGCICGSQQTFQVAETQNKTLIINGLWRERCFI